MVLTKIIPGTERRRHTIVMRIRTNKRLNLHFRRLAQAAHPEFRKTGSQPSKGFHWKFEQLRVWNEHSRHSRGRPKGSQCVAFPEREPERNRKLVPLPKRERYFQ